ncbi:MAG: hypothetical protein M3P11_11405 [Actinomycetota bacterium]|nr:hypothetical protein [Actinomycetota bacterium]
MPRAEDLECTAAALAVKAATAMVDAVKPLGVEIRAGTHGRDRTGRR